MSLTAGTHLGPYEVLAAIGAGGSSADGRFLLYEQTARTTDVWALALSGDRKPFPIVQTQFNEGRAHFSSDGRWIAYMSDESGRQEIYVTTFPKADGKWQVSVAGGSWPRWRRDGREIFYLEGDRLMAVPVKASGSSFQVSRPQQLFEFASITNAGYQYDVTADGQRFLVSRLPQQEPAPITLVVNWPALLRTTTATASPQPSQ